MGDFSVKAVLSAVDKNFSSTMKSALGYTKNLKSTLTSGIGFGVMMGIGQTAVTTVMNQMSGLSKETINTSDSMYKLQAAMRFSGYAEDEIQRIAGSTGSLKTYADKTVFSLRDVMSTFGALSANGIQDADKLTEAVGNAVAVFGGGAQEYSSVALAFSQAMAAGSLHAQDWNQILNASPQLAGGLRKELIRLNPVLGVDFKGAMEDGAITADLLGEAMNNIGMTDMAKEAATSVTTFEGAIGNLEATVVSGMMKLYDSFAKSSVIDAINGMNSKVGSGFDWLSVAIPTAVNKISPYWNVIKTDAKIVKDAFSDTVGSVVGEIGKLTGSFGSTKSVASFARTMGKATGALKSFAGFCKEHSDAIAKVITVIPKLIIAYKGFKIVKAVAPFVDTFSKGILMLAGKGVGAIAGKLLGIGAAEKVVGESSVVSAKQMLQSATAFLALGAGVALICAGFWLLSSAAVNLANAGPLAIATMLGMTVAIGALLLVAKSVAPTLTAGAIGFVAFGAAVVLAGAGMMLMTNAAISLANAGPLAIGVMVGMVAAIALLAVGAAALGPALTMGAVGFIAFGAAIVMVGVGALLASAALSVVAGVLPTVVQYGAQGAVAIMALGVGMTVFAVGATLAGAGCIVLGAGLVVATAGLIAFSAGIVVTSAGMLVLAASLTAVNSSMKSIAKNAKSAQTSLNSMKSSTSVVSSGLDAIGNKAKSAMNALISAFDGAASKSSSSGKKVGSGFNSGLSTGMVAAIGTANSGTTAIISILNAAGNRSYNCGAYIGQGLANGMLSQLGPVRSAAAQLAEAADAAIRAKAKINSPSKVSKKLGGYWGSGWAGGMLSKAKDAWKAAQELVKIPEVVASRQDFSFAGGYGNMDLSESYNYYSESKYTIVVPVNLEGREIARASAEYTQEELEKGDNLKNMLKGVRSV